MAALENAKTAEEAGRAILNVIRDEIKAYLAKAVAAQALQILEKVPPPLSFILAAVAGGATAFLFNKLIPEFYAGGHTGPGTKYEPAGIVHKKEYVIPQEGTENPNLKPIIDIIEMARQNGSLNRLDLSPIVQAIPRRQFAAGGYTTTPTAGADLQSVPTNGTAGADLQSVPSDALLQKLDQVADRIEKMNISISIEKYERECGKYAKIQQTKGL